MLYQNSQNTVQLFGQTVPEPRVLLDFLGFETHVRQIRDKRGVGVSPLWYDHAGYYIIDLPADKMFGPGETVSFPACVKAPDYEFEIGCLATRHALLTNLDEALTFFKEHCYLTILNDWSARDIQKKDMEGLGPSNSKFVTGKSIGPKLVKASDIKMDENGVMSMAMKLSINGQLRSESNYETLYHTHPTSGEKAAWSFPRIFTFLGKQNIAVQPGYLFGSGTVGSGCIAEFMAKVDPTTGVEIAPATLPWLKDGDVVTMEVEGIGVLENKVAIKELSLAGK
ncbi:MAG: fumarylacetoacetate hydrolase family protein [Cyanobacteria bacterium REEB67]|nr:fumarylacetoacetate hydrolase family protein [Cyanobacteria bacterium REEB67]